MKMKPEHYAIIRDSIQSLIPLEWVQRHWEMLVPDQRVKDIAKRVRWDCYWYARTRIERKGVTPEKLYAYLDDGHLDTALRAIMKELNFPQ